MQVFLETIVEARWQNNDNKWAHDGSNQFPEPLQKINLSKIQQWENGTDDHY